MATDKNSEIYKKKKLVSFEDIKGRLQGNLDNRVYLELLKFYTDVNFKDLLREIAICNITFTFINFNHDVI